jgi:hypothetical protein
MRRTLPDRDDQRTTERLRGLGLSHRVFEAGSGIGGT